MDDSVWIAGLVGVVVAMLLTRLANVQRRLERLARIEAKVDALMKSNGVRFDPFDGLPPQASDALLRGSKIEAIKAYREATGAGLKEAKDIIDDALRRRPSQA
jgi:hypothetical protein